jgi:hypothetical protein
VEQAEEAATVHALALEAPEHAVLALFFGGDEDFAPEVRERLNESSDSG